MKKRIFVVDDHPVMRRGYAAIINAEPDLTVRGEAASAVEALDKIAREVPDLIIVDISLEGMSGIELIKQLAASYPGLPVLVVSMHSELLYAERALYAGASGYLMKTEVESAVIRAIRLILKGGLYLSEQMNSRILRQYTSKTEEDEQSPLDRLGDRELEVFELIGKGFTTQKVAEVMQISPKTVESHRARIKRKLGIDSTSELRQKAVLWVHQQERRR